MYECVTCNCMIACVCDLLGGMQYKVGDKLLNSIKIKNKIFSLYPLTFITKYGSSGVLNTSNFMHIYLDLLFQPLLFKLRGYNNKLTLESRK